MKTVSSILRVTSFLAPNILPPTTSGWFRPYYQPRRRMSESLFSKEELRIGTHDGIFHSDEILGCFLLKTLFPKASIKRTRDPQTLAECDVVLDVGGVYDPSVHRYDHHQRTFDHVMSTLSDEIQADVKLSSAGLIYHHFGKKVLRKLLDSENEDLLKFVYVKVYHSFVKEIDGIDNGVPAYESEPLYSIHTDLSSRVGRLNKPWYFEGKWDENERFYEAMEVVGGEFTDAVRCSRDVNYRARDIVETAIRRRFEVHESGEIIELSMFCPWLDHLLELERIRDIKPEIKYVLWGGQDGYRVRGVPVAKDSFLGRKFLPESWRGLRDKELSQVAGVDGCIFAHANGFIGGNATREGALQMAVNSLHS